MGVDTPQAAAVLQWVLGDPGVCGRQSERGAVKVVTHPQLLGPLSQLLGAPPWVCEKAPGAQQGSIYLGYDRLHG